MAIAEVTSITNTVFINSNLASEGMSIDYGDVIETYDIGKGLEESGKSGDIVDDGILGIKFLADETKIKIKPHVKVIFKTGGKWAGSNTIQLHEDSVMLSYGKDLEVIKRIDSESNKLIEVARRSIQRGIAVPYETSYSEFLKLDGCTGLEDPLCPLGYRPIAYSEVFSTRLYHSDIYETSVTLGYGASILTAITSHTYVDATKLHDHIKSLECEPYEENKATFGVTRLYYLSAAQA